MRWRIFKSLFALLNALLRIQLLLSKRKCLSLIILSGWLTTHWTCLRSPHDSRSSFFSKNSSLIVRTLQKHLYVRLSKIVAWGAEGLLSTIRTQTRFCTYYVVHQIHRIYEKQICPTGLTVSTIIPLCSFSCKGNVSKDNKSEKVCHVNISVPILGWNTLFSI